MNSAGFGGIDFGGGRFSGVNLVQVDVVQMNRAQVDLGEMDLGEMDLAKRAWAECALAEVGAQARTAEKHVLPGARATGGSCHRPAPPAAVAAGARMIHILRRQQAVHAGWRHMACAMAS